MAQTVTARSHHAAFSSAFRPPRLNPASTGRVARDVCGHSQKHVRRLPPSVAIGPSTAVARSGRIERPLVCVALPSTSLRSSRLCGPRDLYALSARRPRLRAAPRSALLLRIARAGLRGSPWGSGARRARLVASLMCRRRHATGRCFALVVGRSRRDCAARQRVAAMCGLVAVRAGFALAALCIFAYFGAPARPWRRRHGLALGGALVVAVLASTGTPRRVKASRASSTRLSDVLTHPAAHGRPPSAFGDRCSAPRRTTDSPLRSGRSHARRRCGSPLLGNAIVAPCSRPHRQQTLSPLVAPGRVGPSPDYGRLLLVKIAMFSRDASDAAVNRVRLTGPRLIQWRGGRSRVAAIRRERDHRVWYRRAYLSVSRCSSARCRPAARCERMCVYPQTREPNVMSS